MSEIPNPKYPPKPEFLEGFRPITLDLGATMTTVTCPKTNQELTLLDVEGCLDCPQFAACYPYLED